MKRAFPYYRLLWQEFEDVTIEICRDILGIAAKKFTDGRDGGRDSKFEGKSSKFPSESEQWKGKFIIQAKHTGDVNKSCSDNDFSSTSKNSIISKEIDRLKKLMDEDKFECYLLFTNRKLTASTHNSIKERIKSELNIEYVEIFGIEELDSHLTKEIILKLGLKSNFTPLRIFEKDIQEVIIALDEVIEDLEGVESTKILKITIENKNDLNELSESYFKFINRNSLHHFNKIREFLTQPSNDIYLKYYENTISDLQAKIIIQRSDFHAFEEILEQIIEIVVDKYDEKIKDCRRLVRVFVHYMYYNCDIGAND